MFFEVTFYLLLLDAYYISVYLALSIALYFAYL